MNIWNPYSLRLIPFNYETQILNSYLVQTVHRSIATCGPKRMIQGTNDFSIALPENWNPFLAYSTQFQHLPTSCHMGAQEKDLQPLLSI